MGDTRLATSIPEGTAFFVEEEGERLAFGVVARRQPRGHCIALYLFWPPAIDLTEWPDDLPDPASASFRGRFADRALRDGVWSSMGVHPGFRREQWPFDRILHREFITGRCTLIALDDRNPLKMIGSEPVECDTATGLPSDTLYAAYHLKEAILERGGKWLA
ncbi:hypothetical protein [Petropleomorpha daqingensis]|uniref:Immunity protein 26 n=1 Tax=Petropleomorpha daqingensis TaxID=2026353 RepID=A0A853CLD2_9ACTN|nr:hypothetical protein [Petropleomorpha daqingensis]NYJ08570.1 hypothetical protein [Petropleomorpha daqingensis]